MPFTSDDPVVLQRMLDALAVPMIAVERRSASDPFYLLCVNRAHTERTGLQTTQIAQRRVVDFLLPEDAARAEDRYAHCANLGAPTIYDKRHFINGTATHWRTTLQPVFLPDGRQRIIGTAMTISVTRIRERLIDAAYFAAQAQMQVGKMRHFLELAQSRSDVPQDLRNMSLMVANLTRSVEALLGDIRALAPLANTDWHGTPRQDKQKQHVTT